MQFQQIAISILAQGGEAEAPAPLLAPPFVIGITMFSILLVLLFIAVSYTNLGNRHDPVEEHSDPHRQHPAKHPGLGH
ncbi:hypothetical protein [Arthrobacter bambusae]|uniref:hypothetical protein n=1 Tax=Arthrobacter bambusae TaxID=1338426 RepID=UPI0027803E71|nr:hypothetical protein [Arthrobacter bambusae]MDQ0030493.1 hypothetical protein [Arthrobacter bambusae]MDQ0098410.1 hypothetical protein [Arthrobacter bambusae]